MNAQNEQTIWRQTLLLSICTEIIITVIIIASIVLRAWNYRLAYGLSAYSVLDIMKYFNQDFLPPGASFVSLYILPVSLCTLVLMMTYYFAHSSKTFSQKILDLVGLIALCSILLVVGAVFIFFFLIPSFNIGAI